MTGFNDVSKVKKTDTVKYWMLIDVFSDRFKALRKHKIFFEMKINGPEGRLRSHQIAGRPGLWGFVERFFSISENVFDNFPQNWRVKR